MKIVIEQDQDPLESPREWENLGVMVCFHRRYNLGDETDLKQSMFEGWEELEKHLREEEGAICVLPLFLFDHSGITMNTTGFSCGWDSGQVGFIYVTAATMKTTGVQEADVEEQLRLEVATYDQYLTGDIWGYRILDDVGEEMDSCWGLYGREYAEETAKEALRDALTDSFEDRMKEKSIERSTN